MSADKFKFNYDEEYDILTIYSQVRRASRGIEWGDIDISYDSKGKLAGLQFNKASDLLTNLTKKKVTHSALRQVSGCRLATKENSGILYLTFKLYFKAHSKPPIEDTLAVKALAYHSPITSGA